MTKRVSPSLETLNGKPTWDKAGRVALKTTLPPNFEKESELCAL
jgi:hypothetical protein